MGLIREKPFDSITVQDVLDRAGVSRSTFYVHYKDKNDLFVSDVDQFFAAMATMLSRNGDPSERVAPVREFFAHVAEQRQLLESLAPGGRLNDLFELGRGHLARGIDQRLSELPRGRGISAERRVFVGHAYAGALISLLLWWLNRGTPESPDEMDDLYHGMVWSGVHAEVHRAE
jgi:AcrR family transcriptional regulator